MVHTHLCTQSVDTLHFLTAIHYAIGDNGFSYMQI